MADQADNLRQLVRAHREWRAGARDAGSSDADSGRGIAATQLWRRACRPREWVPCPWGLSPRVNSLLRRLLMKVAR
jgi:hypothetical protein